MFLPFLLYIFDDVVFTNKLKQLMRFVVYSPCRPGAKHILALQENEAWGSALAMLPITTMHVEIPISRIWLGPG